MLRKLLLSTGLLSLMAPAMAFAEEGPSAADVGGSLDAVWVMLAAILVIFMQAGFALLEAGSTRMKNAGHVAGKTVLTFGVCALAFWAIGFGLAFGDGNAFIGMGGFFVDGTQEQVLASISAMDSTTPIGVLFLFQLAFAGVSLAVAFGGFAERAKLSVYLIFGVIYVAFIYPFVAHWVWGGGWLADHGKQDFAGSTVVHLQGATAALVATMMLKPRIGKYNKDKTSNLIPGHNQVLSVLGVIILWVGWFGFNAGSTLGVSDGFFGYVAMTTNMAAAAGGVAALLVAWMYFGKADIPSMLNGVLAALVAITASCAFVTVRDAVIIGLVAGVFTFFVAQWIDKAGIDDPIFAVSVHGVAGVWGTLATGIFAHPTYVEIAGVGKPGLLYGGGLEQLGVQAMGVVTAFVFVAVLSFIVLYVIKLIVGLRVNEEEEIIGLDLAEHGSYGYPEQIKKAQGGTTTTI